jgi:twitching motility protein PilT
MLDFDNLMASMWANRSTDLLLTTGELPAIRTNGMLARVEGADVLTADDVLGVLGKILNRNTHNWTPVKEEDFSFTWNDQARIRGNAFMQRGNPAASFRMLGFDIPSFDDLRVPQSATWRACGRVWSSSPARPAPASPPPLPP